MFGIMTSSLCVCLDVSRIYSNIHQISDPDFFLTLSISVRKEYYRSQLKLNFLPPACSPAPTSLAE